MADEHQSASPWQESLRETQDGRMKEWMCIERRYHAKKDTSVDGSVTITIPMALSDPDLPADVRQGRHKLIIMLPKAYPLDPPAFDVSAFMFLNVEDRSRLEQKLSHQASRWKGSHSLRKVLTWLDNHVVAFMHLEDTNQSTVVSRHEGNEATAADSELAAVEALCVQGKKSRRACHFFARGRCQNGESCRFQHVAKKEKRAQAKDADKASTEAIAPLPSLKQKQSRCKFFQRTRCKMGSKCPYLHDKQQPDQHATVFESPPSLTVIDISNHSGSSLKKGDASTDSTGSTGHGWTETQQLQLDAALKKFPGTMSKAERWESIAKQVDGKTLRDCIDRYQYLCKLVKTMQQRSHEQAGSEVENGKGSSEAEQPLDKRIIPSTERTAIDTDPQVDGTQIRLEDLFLHATGTVIPQKLVCNVQCMRCPLRFDANLSLRDPSILKWCPRCSARHAITLRPTFAHVQSTTVAWIDTDNCIVTDVLPSDFIATCLGCNEEVLFDHLEAGKRAERSCFSCHVKMALMCKRYAIGHVTEAVLSATESDSNRGKKVSVQRKITENFVIGQPLPNKGACEHYKHSYRWFRFQCCGKTFPCDVCHDRSDCPEASTGKIASRMICGLCSREQSSSNSVCVCGNEVGKRKHKTRHWEGGRGCRNQALMSSTDRQKYRGRNKTESQKHKRVGAVSRQREATPP